MYKNVVRFYSHEKVKNGTLLKSMVNENVYRVCSCVDLNWLLGEHGYSVSAILVL